MFGIRSSSLGTSGVLCLGSLVSVQGGTLIRTPDGSSLHTRQICAAKSVIPTETQYCPSLLFVCGGNVKTCITATKVVHRLGNGM